MNITWNYSFSLLFSGLSVCYIFLKGLDTFLKFFPKPLTYFCWPQSITNLILLRCMKLISGKRLTMHHEVFYFRSLYFSRKQLGFTSMTFRAATHYNHQQVHSFLSFRWVIFQSFLNNCRLFTVTSQLIDIFLHVLIRVLQSL